MRQWRQGPQQIASPPSSKAPSLQTVKERKLRRFARRVVEYQKNPLPQLQEKLVRDGPHLHHSLALFSLDDPRLVGAVLDLANSEAMAASKLRLEAWKDCVQENPTKLGKWVKQLPPACPTASFDGLILPADRAKCAALDWEKHWNPESLPDMNQVDQLCSQLGPATDPLPDDCIQVSGSELARIALKAKDKASGMDAWTAAHLCNLPIAFWEQVGVLWDACLRHGRVPAMWKEVRIALLPKPTGGMRPLAIVTVLCANYGLGLQNGLALNFSVLFLAKALWKSMNVSTKLSARQNRLGSIWLGARLMSASVLIQSALRLPFKCGDGLVPPQQFVICLLIFTANSVDGLLGRVLFTLTRYLLGVVCCKAVQPALLCSMH